MMKVIESVQQWKELRRTELKDLSLGFAPTMGALHEGHLSLVKRSRKDNDLTLVSIFVNPTQFNDPQDLKNYPRPFEADKEKLESADVDYLLYPSYTELYADNYNYSITEKEMSPLLCGAHRPGHFQGMLTVVMKLLQIAQAQRAYFGEKDYQQLLLIKGMAQAFFLETEIVGCPTVREKDGLAMSSRNQLLTSENRELAPEFHRQLVSSEPAQEVRQHLKEAGFEVEYVEDKEKRRFGAVRLGNVRLIDNVPL